MAELINKSDLISKLRVYRTSPDDENIRYKTKIKNALLRCPELLYALNESELESELFDENGNINWNPETHEPYGEWERYFGDNSNVRPYIFFPETETDVKNYVCYQVMFTKLPGDNDIQKYTNITFTIFCHGNNRTDKMTGIPRHDLIASIIRENFNWSSIFGMKAKLVSSKESITDNNYVVRTLIFELRDLDGIVNTGYREQTRIINNEYWGD